MRNPIKLFFIFLFISNSCQSKIDANTKSFSTYLYSEFSLQIPEKPHFYLIFSNFGCSGCITSSYMETIKYSGCESITIIVSNSSLKAQFSNQTNDKILIDRKHNIDNLNLGIENVSIIETNNGFVNKIYSLPSNETIANVIDLYSLCNHP